ncbi:type III pantothenate kinase [Thiomicrorhabdus immobilis]|uniref:Type III pantothenate kinase n=1 Tax=Thiomicrorhabdus immobilis TaxID=2791037 RepID=A0ABN6D016_9GAMM|nr:type III pantothenate kinase [Thiomicrorhabdus immobilis]BCN94224.1 type III pantothenate kinase [Thiomicrorhabdus immobilis]
MNKLFLDIGNSFVKWSSVIDGQYETYEAIRLIDILDDGFTDFEIDGYPDEVYISSVADAKKVDALKQLIQSEWQIFPIQLFSQKSCCGLTSGYEDFHLLGADRWFAMQGAIGVYKEPTIVIDAGTALTVDAVINGKHLGGFIVPGIHTMRRSLSLDTANLQDYSSSQVANADIQIPDADQLLANDTSSAILGGTLYMTVAFINRIIQDLNTQVGTQFKVVMTGGESLELCPLLDFPYDYIPDLVLQGMVNVVESVKKS